MLRTPKTCLQYTLELAEHQSIDLVRERLAWCDNCRLLADRMLASAREYAWEYPCVEYGLSDVSTNVCTLSHPHGYVDEARPCADMGGDARALVPVLSGGNECSTTGVQRAWSAGARQACAVHPCAVRPVPLYPSLARSAMTRVMQVKREVIWD